jgi:hypothetical protein
LKEPVELLQKNVHLVAHPVGIGRKEYKNLSHYVGFETLIKRWQHEHDLAFQRWLEEVEWMSRNNDRIFY